jgi:hypothetical protein
MSLMAIQQGPGKLIKCRAYYGLSCAAKGHVFPSTVPTCTFSLPNVVRARFCGIEQSHHWPCHVIVIIRGHIGCFTASHRSITFRSHHT